VGRDVVGRFVVGLILMGRVVMGRVSMGTTETTNCGEYNFSNNFSCQKNTYLYI
jgi:hypothetical protein